MVKKTRLVVNKVFLKEYVDIPQQFQKMPILYLELLENKSKILESAKNQDYTPIDVYDLPLTSQVKIDKKDEIPLGSREFVVNKKPRIIKPRIIKPGVDNTEEIVFSDLPVQSRESSSHPVTPQSQQGAVKDDDFVNKLINEDIQNHRANTQVENYSPLHISTSNKSTRESVKSTPQHQSAASKRLADLLREGEKIEQELNKSVEIEHDVPETPKNNISTTIPPKLSDILGGTAPVPQSNLSSVVKPVVTILTRNTQEDQEDKQRRELFRKFDILKRSHRSAEIPEFSDTAQVYLMQSKYDEVFQKITLDSNVETYRTFLQYGFVGMEFILGKYMNFKMSGFANEQMSKMQSYDALLVELGEKSYMSSFSNLPVEIRLIGLIIINAVVFIVTKKVTESFDVGNLINMMKPSTEPKKPKMKGPQVDLDDLL